MEFDFPLEIGERAEFSKTLLARDIDVFAEISGDYDPIHVDEDYARNSIFGGRIAHGILSMALLSTVAAMISHRAKERGSKATSVSLGYDSLRFLKPVFPGDSLTAVYIIESFDSEKLRSYSAVEIRNQHDEVCVTGRHIMKWLTT